MDDYEILHNPAGSAEWEKGIYVKALKDLRISSNIGAQNEWRPRVANRMQELREQYGGPAYKPGYIEALGRMSVEDMLKTTPELRPYYEAYKPMFDQYVASGGPMKISTSQWLDPAGFGRPDMGDKVRADKLGVRYARNADELAWNWMYDYLVTRGMPGYGVNVAPWYEPLTPEQWVNERYDYNADKSWWEKKGAPGLQTGLSFLSMFPGLSPIGALGSTLGSALGSKIAGNALAGAIGSAAMGGDPMKGGLTALAGGLGGKLTSTLGAKTGGALSGGLSAAMSGGNVLSGLAGGYLSGAGANVTHNNGGGGGEAMGGINWKDIIGPAVAGALLNQSSAGTGAAAGAALGLMGAGGLNFGDNKLEGVLNSALEGYLSNRLLGQNGGDGAVAGAANGLYNTYIANGKNDDILRELLGIPPGSSMGNLGDLGGVLGGLVAGKQDDVLRDILRGKIEEALDKYLGKSGGSYTAAQPAPAYQMPDIYSLYNQYYNQLPAGDAGGYEAAVKRNYDATKAMLDEGQRQQGERIDSDLNRRGLFSSGIALNRQDELRNKYLEQLGREAGQSALDIAKMRADAENQRRAQAMEFAQSRMNTLMKYPESLNSLPSPGAVSSPASVTLFGSSPQHTAGAGDVSGLSDAVRPLPQPNLSATNNSTLLGAALDIFKRPSWGEEFGDSNASTSELLESKRSGITRGTRLFADIFTPPMKNMLFSFAKKHQGGVY